MWGRRLVEGGEVQEKMEKTGQAYISCHSNPQSTVRLSLPLGLWKITADFSVDSHVCWIKKHKPS